MFYIFICILISKIDEVALRVKSSFLHILIKFYLHIIIKL